MNQKQFALGIFDDVLSRVINATASQHQGEINKLRIQLKAAQVEKDRWMRKYYEVKRENDSLKRGKKRTRVIVHSDDEIYMPVTCNGSGKPAIKME